MRKTVLLVEDNDDNRHVYALILRHAGYRVVEARTGDEAVSLARSELPDLILMDISIPAMDGLQATSLLKAEGRTAEIPVVALTAHALAMHRRRAREVGCDGYLTKPCEPRTVVAEVARFIGPPTVAAE
ncbi:MAG TPA: response regulator [Longimicrobiales bacterium]|nr:response regulator [Longimicrobiales bacterium]